MQKKSPRCSQKCAKLAILGSKLAILGTSWRQVGQLSAILAPTWAILAPRWAPRGMQKGVRKRLEMKFDTRWKWPRLPRSGHFQKAPKKLPKWSRNLIKNDLKIVPKTRTRRNKDIHTRTGTHRHEQRHKHRNTFTYETKHTHRHTHAYTKTRRRTQKQKGLVERGPPLRYPRTL